MLAARVRQPVVLFVLCCEYEACWGLYVSDEEEEMIFFRQFDADFIGRRACATY